MWQLWGCKGGTAVPPLPPMPGGTPDPSIAIAALLQNYFIKYFYTTVIYQ